MSSDWLGPKSWPDHLVISLITDSKTPSWMKQWLEKGLVPPGYNVEHKVPLSIGGSDSPANMRLVLKADHDIHHFFYHPWR